MLVEAEKMPDPVEELEQRNHAVSTFATRLAATLCKKGVLSEEEVLALLDGMKSTVEGASHSAAAQRLNVVYNFQLDTIRRSFMMGLGYKL